MSDRSSGPTSDQPIGQLDSLWRPEELEGASDLPAEEGRKARSRRLVVRKIKIKKRRQRRRRGRVLVRRAALGLLFALLAVVFLMGLSSFPALSAKSDLERGKHSLQNAKDAFIGGDAATALLDFAAARSSFARATSAAKAPQLTLLGWLPFIGRTPDTIRTIAEAGQLVSQAGEDLARGIAALPGGVAALTPQNGVFPIDHIVGVTPAVARASGLVQAADQKLSRTVDSFLLPPVSAARREALKQVDSINRTLTTATIVLRGLPSFLGESGPKRYFFAVQNPAELRGTGGFMGAYSILTFDHGRYAFSDFRPIEDLPTFDPSQIEAPNPDYSRNYDPFGGAGFFPNMNMTPDFPSAATAIERAYVKATRAQLDGVIASDPFTLAALLSLTGPVKEFGISVDAQNVVRFTTNLAYGRFANSKVRKLILGAVAKEVFDRFTSVPKSSSEAVQAIARAASQGHLLLASVDPELERGLQMAGVGGHLGAAPGDFLSLVQNNASGTKVDFYLRRSVDYTVQLMPNGAASATALVSFDNQAPTRGQPREVIGPFRGVSKAGESVSIIRLYSAASSILESSARNGVSWPLAEGGELGFPFYQGYFKIPSRDSMELRYSLRIQSAWQGDELGGVYRLTFLNQSTIKPTSVRVEIRIPQGMTVVSADPATRTSRTTVVWQGKPDHELVLEVRFQASFSKRFWQKLLRVFNKPILHL